MGNPISGAQVSLISNSYPYGHEKRRLVQTTKSTGILYFPRIKEWRTEALVIHGAEYFFWNWCISKDGYLTHVTSWRSGEDFRKKYEVTLREGSSEKCSPQK